MLISETLQSYEFFNMKVIELLKLNRQLLNVCRAEGIRINDVRYIELYNGYRHMLAIGDKVSYIVALLAVRYNVSERKVYSLIKRLQADCNLGAV